MMEHKTNNTRVIELNSFYNEKMLGHRMVEA